MGNQGSSGSGRYIEVDPITSLDVNQLNPHPDHASTKSAPVRIGGGSFARVYRAEMGDVIVAVKVLDISDGKQAGELVEGEAAMMLRVACPQVISLYGVTGVKNHHEPPALVMEYAKHGSLEAVLKSSEALPWHRRVRMLTDIARALIRCHQAKPTVVHMDLKPANVLVCQGWRAKLGDFGCSKLNEYTRTHSIISGTPVYLAPEARSFGAHPTRAWDVYSFGLTMFAVLTRIEPWSALRTTTELNNELEMKKRPIIPAACIPAIGAPAGYIELMNECWDHDPDRRPSFHDGYNAILPRLRRMLEACEAMRSRFPPSPLAVTPTSSNGSGMSLSPLTISPSGHVRNSSDTPMNSSSNLGSPMTTSPSPTSTIPSPSMQMVFPSPAAQGPISSAEDVRFLREAKAKSESRYVEELKRMQQERQRDLQMIASLRAALAEARKDAITSSTPPLPPSAISGSSSGLVHSGHFAHINFMSHGYTGIVAPPTAGTGGDKGTPSPPRSPVPVSSTHQSTANNGSPPVVHSFATARTSATSVTNQVSHLFSYCATRDQISPARLVRRCVECHTDEIADIKEASLARWSDVHASWDGCVHTNPASTCRSTKWRFVPNACICCVSQPHSILPGVMCNFGRAACEALVSSPGHTPRQCGRIESVILRFSCGHFVCWRCWRRYACEKLDHDEIGHQKGYPDGTISCPKGCRSFIRSKALFYALGRARRDQYDKLCQRLIENNGINPIETTAGRSDLKALIPAPPRSRPCPNCKTSNERGATLNSHVICRSCHFEWCWGCSIAWNASCNSAHILCYY